MSKTDPTCPKCRGAQILVERTIGLDGRPNGGQNIVACPKCKGTGKV